MKTRMKAIATMILIIVVVISTGCKKQKEQEADVQTTNVTNVTSSTATAGGIVVSDGNSTVIERGVCWNKEGEPTVSDYHVSAGSGLGSFTCEITGLEADTRYYVRAYALNNIGISYGAQTNFKTTIDNGGGGGNGGGNGTYNGHDYVDLGLQSGTLWATCNVGVTTPEGFGDYFAWGETLPKDIYNWNTYQYWNGSDNTLTKYCNNAEYGYNGFTDNLTILLPEDDAATANWGAGWCTPTIEQWEELYQNTTNTWTTQNGVSGCLFTANNGQSLFLPAAGGRSDDEFYEGFGEYWSSSLTIDCPVGAEIIDFNSDECFMTSGERYNGVSVRPVRSAR